MREQKVWALNCAVGRLLLLSRSQREALISLNARVWIHLRCRLHVLLWEGLLKLYMNEIPENTQDKVSVILDFTPVYFKYFFIIRYKGVQIIITLD